MRTVTIVGARPQFIKLAPVSRAIASASRRNGVTIEDLIVHTGQHYDPEMSRVFFDELEIPKPHADLAIGSGSHGTQTAKMLESIEAFLLEQQPDAVIVYGDTNSTVAGALAAAKLCIPLAHIEAGLRSFDRRMPEEVNRIVADHLSEILFAPTKTAVENLDAENLGDRTQLSGDVMYDAVLYNSELAAKKSTILDRLDIDGSAFAVATIHRPANTEAVPLRKILDAFNDIASAQLPIVFPMHPRTQALVSQACPDWQAAERLKIVEPLGYLDMLSLLEAAHLALTDSGGLQKEAFFVKTPCVTLRDTTEWPETVAAGANVLVDIERDAIVGAVTEVLDRGAVGFAGTAATAEELFGNGDAASRIVAGLLELTA